MVTGTWRRRWGGLFGALVACAVVAQACSAPSGEQPGAVEVPGVVYVYDDLGRLRGVIDPSGDAATYRYDPVGNVVGINRFSSAELSVIEVSPRRANVGDEVAVRGTGFSARIDENRVEIGGVEADIVEAGRFELTAVVPEEAVSGPVTVAVGDGSASGADEVEVVVERPPVIEGFSPGVAGAGERVTIEGDNFADDRLLNAVMVDGEVYATVESASATELVVRLPAAVASGRVTVTTPSGRAESSDDLVVVPPPLAGGDLDAAMRATPGEPATIELEGRDRRVGLVVFDAEAGQRPRMSFSDWSFPPCGLDYGLFGPGGVEVVPLAEFSPERVQAACDEEFAGLPPRLPVTGTYALALVPVAEEPGSVDVTVELDEPEDPAAGDERAIGTELLDPPGGLLDGDDRYPVDLATGQFVFEETDLVVDDVLPAALSRGYRPPGRFEVRSPEGAFGSGSALEFDLSLRVAPVNQTADLVLAGGGAPVVYERVTDGIDEASAVFEHTSTPSVFRASRITWNGDGWDLELRDGTTLVFHREGPLEAVRDRVGNQLAVHREADEYTGRPGRVQSVTSPFGRSISFAYGPDNRVAEATDHLGRRVRYGYDDQGRLASVAYADGAGRMYGYDGDGRLATIAGPQGAVVANEYDADGRVVGQVLADGSTFSFRYVTDTDGRVTQTEVTDPAGLVRRVAFDAGHWSTDTWAVGTAAEQTATAERDPQTRRVTAIVDSTGRTSLGHDELGRVVSITELDGTPDAVATTFTYVEDSERLASVTDPSGQTTSFGYDRAGNVTRITGPAGRETAYDYDRRGRLVGVNDAAGGVTEIGYAGLHRVAVTDPRGHTAVTFLDAGGRVAVGTDPTGISTRFGHDDLDRLVSVVDPTGAETRFGYDPVGNLVSVTDANGNTTRFARDGRGRVVTRTDPLGAVDRYAYDPAGRLVEHVDRRGVVSQFGYDGLGRPTGARFGVHPGGAESSIEYRYDTGGRLDGVADSAYGVVDFEYDGLGRLVAESSPQGEIGYGYDAAGRRTRMSVTGGPETTYGYDAAGFLSTIGQGDAGVSVTRDPVGRPVRLELPNGVAVDQGYDPAGYLTELDYGGEGSLGYGYDAAGRRTAVYGSMAATGLPEPVAHAGYDPANRLVAWGDTELVHDPAGNLVDDGTNTYTWDARGQLIAVAGSTSASFAYDPFGRRVAKTVDGVTTRYLHDGPNVVRHQTGDGPPVDYLTGLGLDETLARIDGDRATTLLADGLGSVVGLVDGDGRLAARYSYEPFGAHAGDPDADGVATANPFGFTGRERDETGLYFYRARYYQPDTGRFISEDPLGFAAGDPNLYAYVANSPTNHTDPTGTCFAAAWVSFDRSFELLDQGTALLEQAAADAEATGEVSDQTLIAHAQLVEDAQNNLNQFFEACGVELTFWQMALPTIGGLAGALRATTSRLLPGATRLGPTAGRPGPVAPQTARAAASVADDVIGAQRVTVLGRYRGGTEAFVGKPGFNVLDLPSRGTGRWYWSRNRAFIDDAIAGGDELRLVTNPFEPLYSGGNVYQRELRYLRDLGYRFEQSGDYWVAVPGR